MQATSYKGIKVKISFGYVCFLVLLIVTFNSATKVSQYVGIAQALSVIAHTQCLFLVR